MRSHITAAGPRGWAQAGSLSTCGWAIYFPYVLVDSLRLAEGIKIRQYQIIQMEPEVFRVRYVADSNLSDATQ